MKCRRCGRRLVNRTEWFAMSAEDRKKLNRTHAVQAPDGLCGSCRKATGSGSKFAYDGGWYRRGGVWYPLRPA